MYLVQTKQTAYKLHCSEHKFSKCGSEGQRKYYREKELEY